MSFYRHNAQYCFSDQGVDKAQVDGLVRELAPYVAELKARKHKASAALLALPSRTDDVAAIETLAQNIRKQFKQVVVVGSGGSGLSGRVFAEFKPNPMLHFLENI